ncbi:MAG: hypothetical protein E7420_00555 [Ruminococcaceae bacterium]|nr:hypothetical protein [Oscillospiraceae bacterium]
MAKFWEVYKGTTKPAQPAAAKPLTGFAAGVQANNAGYRALATSAADKTTNQATAALSGALNAGLNYKGSLTAATQSQPEYMKPAADAAKRLTYSLPAEVQAAERRQNSPMTGTELREVAANQEQIKKDLNTLDLYANRGLTGTERLENYNDALRAAQKTAAQEEQRRTAGLTGTERLATLRELEQQRQNLEAEKADMYSDPGKYIWTEPLTGTERREKGYDYTNRFDYGTELAKRGAEYDSQIEKIDQQIAELSYINYEKLTYAPDFDKYAKIGAGMESELRDNPDGGSHLGNVSAEIYEGSYTGFDLLTRDEQKIHNYLLGKYGKESAEQYYEFMRTTVNHRYGQRVARAIQNSDWKTGALIANSLGTGVTNWMAGALGAYGAVTGQKLPENSLNYASQYIKEDLGKAGQIAYDLGVTVGNMLPSVLVGGPAGIAMHGISAGGNAYQQGLREGMTEGQAWAYGLAVGASEACLQRIMGGISRLGGVTDDVIKAASGVENGILKFILKTGGSAIKEGSEEALQAVLEPIFKSIVTGDKLNIDWSEVAYNALMGTLTGGVFEATQNAAESITDVSVSTQPENAEFVTAYEDVLAKLPKRENRVADSLNDENPMMVYGEEGGLVYDSFVRRNIDSKTADIINTVAKALGIKVLFADSIAGGMANAQIANGTVLIEKGNPNPVRFLFGHEITHRMQELAPKEYSRLRDTIAANSESVDAAIRKMQVNYAKYGKDINKENAMDEVVADYVGRLLEDKGELERFIAKNRGDRSLMQKLRDFIHEIRLRLMDSEYAARLRQVEQRLSETLNAAVNQTQNIESTQKNAAQESGGEKLSFKGYTQDGRGIYEANFPAGTPKSIKAQRILSYIKNVWSKRPINLVIHNPDGTTRTIQAQFDPTYDESGNEPSDASKLMGGNRHGTAAERRATLDLADDYYQIASESEYNYSKDEEGKSSITHNGVREWHYFVNDILFREYGETEAIPYRVTINVKERSDGNFVYSFNAEKQNGRMDTRRTLHADVNPSENREANAQPSKYSLSQKDETVNGQYSLKTPQEPTSFLYLERLAEQAKKNGNHYTQRLLQRQMEKVLKNHSKTDISASTPTPTIYADYMREHNMLENYETSDGLNVDLENDANSDTIFAGAVTDCFDRKVGITSAEEDLVAVNPNFSTHNYEWRNNCQRCVPAYEMRRRGFRVVAKPLQGNVLDDILANNAIAAWKRQERVWCVKGNGLQQIKEQMAKWGNGARAEVLVAWRDNYPDIKGHVFVAEQRNGTTVFIDPQTGDSDCSRYFDMVVRGQTSIWRIDDNIPSDLIFECCINEGAKK